MEAVKIILNPYSGRGRGDQLRRQIGDTFSRAGIDHEIAVTDGPGHGIELAQAAREAGYRVIAAAGGDGTVSEVMNGIALATPPGETVGTLALLPVGSANDFTDELGYPRDLSAAVEIIASGRRRRVDLGYVEVDGGERSRYFDNNMGMGFEARVTMESYKIKRLQGSALYVAAALRTLPQFKAPHLELSCELENGETWQRSDPTLLVTIGNTRRTGGGFYLTPDALPDDGYFDVGIAKALPVWRVMTLLPKALYGKHTSDSAVTMLRCRTIHARCEEGLPVQLDGEILAQAAHEVRVEVQPLRLEIIA
jgi:YegS/Rv2252/BmrU family lipid kinase